VKEVILGNLQSTPFLNPSPPGGRRHLGTRRSTKHNYV
jgi:hypothetical protein